MTEDEKLQIRREFVRLLAQRSDMLGNFSPEEAARWGLYLAEAVITGKMPAQVPSAP